MPIFEAEHRTCPVCRDRHLCHQPTPEIDPPVPPDHLTEYIQAHLEPLYGPWSRDWTQSSVLYRHYRIWANRRGFVPLSLKGFGRGLGRLGFTKIKVSAFYWSVRIR